MDFGKALLQHVFCVLCSVYDASWCVIRDVTTSSLTKSLELTATGSELEQQSSKIL